MSCVSPHEELTARIGRKRVTHRDLSLAQCYDRRVYVAFFIFSFQVARSHSRVFYGDLKLWCCLICAIQVRHIFHGVCSILGAQDPSNTELDKTKANNG